jgi:NAD-dependent SIR2 family protein deacetylase
MIKMYCDKCHEQMESARKVVFDKDLCANCWKELATLMRGYLEIEKSRKTIKWYGK